MAQKKINKNLVAFLTVMGIVLSVVVVAIATYQGGKRDPEVFARNAAEREQAGDHERALDFYQRAYGINREVKYLVSAAQCAYRMGMLPQSLAILQQANAERPEDREVITAILERFWELMRYNIYRWTALRDFSDKMLQLAPDDMWGLASRALALHELTDQDPRNPILAAEALRKAQSLNATDPRVALVLARRLDREVAVLLDRLAEGKAGADADTKIRELRQQKVDTLKQALDAHTNDSWLAVRYAQVLSELDKLADAIAALDKSLTVMPSDASLHMEKARLLFRDAFARRKDLKPEELARQLETVRTHATRAIELEPAYYEAYITNAQSHLMELADDAPQDLRAARFEQALKLYDDAIRQTVGLRSVRAQIDLGGRAQLLFESFRAAVTYNETIQAPERKKAGLDAARRFLADAKAQYPEEFFTHVMQGQMSISEGDIRGAVAAFEKAVAKTEGFNQYYYRLSLERLAFLYRQLGEDGLALQNTDKALTAYRQSGETPPVRLVVNRGSLLNIVGRHQDAYDLATEQLKVYPNEADLLHIKAAAAGLLGRREEAEKIYEKSAKTDESTALRSSAMLAAHNEDWPTAEQKFRAYMLREPDDLEALRVLMRVMTAAQRQAQAREFLKELAPLSKEPRTAQVLRAFDVSLSTTDPKERDVRILELIATVEDPARQALEYYNFWNDRGDLAKAADYLDQLEKLQPDDGGVAERQFFLALRRTQLERAEQYLNKLTALNYDRAGGARYRGQLAYNRGDAAQAVTEFRSAVAVTPGDSNLKVSLAQALLALPQSRAEEAIAVLKEAVENNPRNFNAHRLLFAVYEQLGQRQEGISNLQAAARLKPNDPFVVERSQLIEEETDPKKGIARRETVRKEKPQDLENLVRLGQLYTRVRDDVRADECFKAAMEIDAADRDLAAAIAEFYSRRGDRETGESLLKRHVEARKGRGRIRAHVVLSAFYERLGDLVAARDALLQAEQVIDRELPEKADQRLSHVEIQLQLVEFYARIELVREMVEHSRRVLELLEPAETNLIQRTRLRVISGLLRSRRYGDAEQAVNAYVKDFPRETRGLVARAQLELARNRREDARNTLTLVLQAEPENAWALYTRGTLNLEIRRFDEARGDLLKAKQLQPEGFQYAHRTRLALLYEMTGQNELAETELRELIEVQPGNEQLANRLLDLFKRAGRLDKAQEALTQFMARQPKVYYWPYQLGLLLIDKREYSAAVDALRKAAELSLGTNPLVFADFLYALTKANRPGEAVKAFNDLPEQYRAPLVRANAALALLTVKKTEEGLAQYQQALIDASQISLPATVIISTRLADTASIPELEAAFRKARDAAPNEPLPQARLGAILVEQLLRGQKAAEALALAETILAAVPPGTIEHLNALMLKARGQHDTGDNAGVVQTYEQVLLHDENHVQALNNLAFIKCDVLNQPKEALKYAERARELAPDSPNVLDTIGWVYYQNDMLPEAESALLRAAQLEPQSAATAYHLGMTYAKRGKRNEARETLNRALALAREKSLTEWIDKAQKALDTLR